MSNVPQPVELAAHIAGIVESPGTPEDKGKALKAACAPIALADFKAILDAALSDDPESTADTADTDNPTAGGSSSNG